MTPREIIARAASPYGWDGTLDDDKLRQRRVRSGALKEADYFIAALDKAGFVIVPKEPSEAMKNAAMLTVLASRHTANWSAPRDKSNYEVTMFGPGYRAMLSTITTEQ